MSADVCGLTFLACAPIAFFNVSKLQDISFAIGLLFLFKWFVGVWECTYGYLECKIRCCAKEQGIINHVVKGIYEGGLILGPVYMGIVAAVTAMSVM